MNHDNREQIEAALIAEDIEAMCDAAERLYKDAVIEDVPWLLTLLQHEDFVVREAAAWPLASLAGPSVLAELLLAYQRGFEDGHDNDGFSTALIELVALFPQAAASRLQLILKSGNATLESHAAWLLGFCEPRSGG